MFFIYIIYSEKVGKYYVGCTSELERRLEQHNSGQSTYTKRGIPWELVYSETFYSLSKARKREIEIKNKKSKKYIEYLVNKD